MARFSALLLSIGLAACSAEVCDARSLEDALAGASSGDVVTVGPCAIDGVSVVVPDGVVLEGANETSVLRAASESSAISLGGGATLRSLRIETSAGRAAIRVEDANDVRIEDVVVRVERGIGLTLNRAERAHIERFTVEGPDAIVDIAPLASPEQGALGIVARNAVELEMADVELNRIGPWGYVTENSSVTWRGGRIADGVGTGVLAASGTLIIEDVEIENMQRGLQPFPAYGLVASAGARVESARVSVRSVEGIGLLHDASPGVHADLSASGNRFGGAWIQRSTDVTFTDCVLEENGVAGLGAVRSSNVRVEGGVIARSELELAILGVSAIEAGDGVYISEPAGMTVLESVMLTDHPRIGLLADLGAGDIASVSLTSVDVSGETLGCLAQDATGLIPLGGWDDGVARAGAIDANDAAQTDPLATVGALSDSNVPELADASLEP